MTTDATSPVLDLVAEPGSLHALVLRSGSNAVYDADVSTQSETILTMLDGQPLRVAAGWNRSSFVHEAGALLALDRYGGVTARVPVTQSIDALVYEPARHRLVAVSRATGQFLYFHDDLTAAGADPLANLAGTSRLSVDLDVSTGALYAHTDGSRIVTKYYNDGSPTLASRQIALQTTGAPRGLLMIDWRNGYLIAEEDGVLREYSLGGIRSHDTPFADVRGGKILTAPRSISAPGPNFYGR